MASSSVKKIRRTYPKGTRLRLIYMQDLHAVPAGTLGTVTDVDDLGQIRVKWDNGSRLALVMNIDCFEKI